MSDDITRPIPPEEEGSGLICDHPLLEKLNPVDRIILASYYASLLKSATVNAQVVAWLYICNLLVRMIQTSDTLSDDQKNMLGGLVMYLNQRMDALVEDATDSDNM